MKRLIPILAVAMLCWPGNLLAQSPGGTGGGAGVGDGTPVKPSGSTGDRKAERSGGVLRKLLNKRVERVDWDDETLGNVFEWVQSQGNVNVIVMWRVLELQGLDADTPVSLRMKQATVRTILTEVLDQISDGDQVRFIGYGNTIKISTRTDLNRKLYTRVYDVADLVFEAPDYEYDGPEFGVAGGELGGGMGGGGGGGGMGGGGFGGSGGGGFGGGGMGGGGFGGGGMGGGGGGFGGGGRGGGGGGDGSSEDEESVEERMDKLIELVTNTIEPESWEENGGQGTIKAFNRLLVVRNNIEVHEKLGGPYFEEGL